MSKLRTQAAVYMRLLHSIFLLGLCLLASSRKSTSLLGVVTAEMTEGLGKKYAHSHVEGQIRNKQWVVNGNKGYTWKGRSQHADFKFPQQDGTGIAQLIAHASASCVELLAELRAYDRDDRHGSQEEEDNKGGKSIEKWLRPRKLKELILLKVEQNTPAMERNPPHHKYRHMLELQDTLCDGETTMRTPRLVETFSIQSESLLMISSNQRTPRVIVWFLSWQSRPEEGKPVVASPRCLSELIVSSASTIYASLLAVSCKTLQPSGDPYVSDESIMYQQQRHSPDDILPPLNQKMDRLLRDEGQFVVRNYMEFEKQETAITC